MLVDNVDLVAKNGSRRLNFGFRDPGNRLPYQVRSLTGLDADEIINHFTGNSVNGGSSFNIPTLVKREVPLLLGLNPEWAGGFTYSDLRDDLYRLIGACPSGQVLIRFNYGTPLGEEDLTHTKAVLVGRISKVEANHFVDKPEVQLTISAEDYPMLQAPEPTEVSNPAWIERTVLSPGGTKAIHLSDDVSTAPHGLDARFDFSASTSNFKMEGLGYLLGLKFELDGFSFAAGDKLYLSSRPDNRYVYVDRSGSVTHLVDKMTADSVWPVIYPGDNYYTWATKGTTWDYGTDGKASCVEVAWSSTFWGV